MIKEINIDEKYKCEKIYKYEKKNWWKEGVLLRTKFHAS